MIGVPSNEFGNQEPADNEEIRTFCDTKFSVSFPLAEESLVKGKDAHSTWISWRNLCCPGASTIIECEMSDYPVEASQGTHFFQNIVSFGVGYLTSDSSDIKWDILDKQEKKGEYGPIKHVRFSKPLHVMLDGQTSKAAVIVAD